MFVESLEITYYIIQSFKGQRSKVEIFTFHLAMSVYRSSQSKVGRRYSV